MTNSRTTFGYLFSLALVLLHQNPGSGAPPFYADKMKLLVYKDDQGREHLISSIKEWEIRRSHILANMQEVMGPLPRSREKTDLDVRVTEEITTPRYVRKKLTYHSELGDRVPAYLFVPTNRQGKVPAILCLHQTAAIGKGEPAGLGKDATMHYAVHLADKGFVTFAPDYPSFGELASFEFGRNGYQSGSMKAIRNNIRAIDLLQGLPEVNPEKIGCIGHSLGGHNTMFTAAFEPRIKVMVSNCGFTVFSKYYRGNLKGWTSPRYMPRIATAYDSNPAKMPFDFSEVIGAFAPRAFLASAPINDDNFEVSGVRDAIEAAAPVYALYGVKDKLAANYPNCKHAFPPEVRTVAYDWLEKWLK